MPDILPPLASSAAPLSSEMVGQLEHSADWARTFGGSDTNLVQRYRHNQDIAAEAEALQQVRAAAQEHLIQTNQVAQNAWFKTQQLDLQHQQAEAKMRHDAEIYPLKLEAEKARTESMLSHDKAMTQALAVKQIASQHQAEDTNAFYSEIADGLKSGVRVGTPEHAALVVSARLKAPGMRSDAFDDMWKTTASHMTPDEAIAHAVERKKALMEVQPPAKPAPPGKPDTYVNFYKELKAMVESYGDASKVPAEKWTQFEARRDAIGKTPKVQPAAGGKEPPTTPPVTTAQAADAGGPDPRIALAKQALEDPNASEEHKAAAKKILGL